MDIRQGAWMREKTGTKGEYARFAAKGFGIDMDEYYAKWNCSKCHATTYQKCHGEDSHKEDISKNISTCDQCHFKKQTATFVGDMPGHTKKGTSTRHSLYEGTNMHGLP